MLEKKTKHDPSGYLEGRVMLRVLRITGVVFFAFLIGLFTYFLQQVYRSGVLLEGYSREWRSSVTLLVFSIIGFSLTGYFELIFLRQRKSVLSDFPEQMDEASVCEGVNTANIYLAPKTLEKWQGHRTRTSKGKHLKPHKITIFWLKILRIASFSTLLTYTLLFVTCLADSSVGLPALCSILGFMLMLSLVSVVGIITEEAWGLVVGYAIALVHLPVFPLGTVVSLILLVSLIGATPWFVFSTRERRRVSRRKRQKKISTT